MSNPNIPTEKLVIKPIESDATEDEIANSQTAQILDFAAKLEDEGKRAWFEVWYPSTTEEDFDAVLVHPDGTIETLPPYSELV